MINSIINILQKILLTFNLVLARYNENLKNNTYINLLNKADYIRLATLELVAREINEQNIRGNIAELGVYKGDFAFRLQQCFLEKKIYLFDTFEGFNRKDIDIENKKFKSTYNDFSDTHEEIVLKRMVKPDMCIIKKGYFPESAVGVEDNFCFVSLDADLFEPIYQGLLFFYPRLQKGGYIFVHDYNNINYPGAKAAVQKFCIENNVSYIPVCDGWGTAIIKK